MNPKDMLTNKAFCPMPWTGLMYNFDGTVKNCIRSAEVLGNIKDNTVEEIVLGTNNDTRQSMILNKIHPLNCRPCLELEYGKTGFDHISDRVFYIRELKSVNTDTYRPNNFDLHTIDVRWTNLCNFSCVYCSPEFSSQWANELKVNIDTPTDPQLLKFKEYIFAHASQLKHVYLAGGEPLLMKENLELLDLLDPDVNIRINTNLSKVNTKIFERICKFKNVHWIVSLETIEDEYEYIRYGGSWKEFLDNLLVIKKLNHKISFNMLWFVLNYKSVFGCIDYLRELGFHNNSFIVGALINPDYLNIRNLPDSVLNSLHTILESKINEHPGYLLEDSYRNMLQYIQDPFNKDLDTSFKELKELDQRRNLDSSKIFKELYNIKENHHGNKTI